MSGGINSTTTQGKAVDPASALLGFWSRGKKTTPAEIVAFQIKTDQGQIVMIHPSEFVPTGYAMIVNIPRCPKCQQPEPFHIAGCMQSEPNVKGQATASTKL